MAWSMRTPSPPGRPLSSRANSSVSVVLASMNREVMPQDDGPLALDDHRCVAADRAQPCSKFLRIVDGGREADEADLGRRQDEHFFPHAAPVRILYEVDLVEHDGVQPLEQVGTGEEHIAQHLGGHDHDGRPRVQRGVAGEQPDVVLSVGGDELAVFLVRQRLERRRVERLAVGAHGTVHGVVRDERLARAGRRRHQDRVAGVERPHRFELELVEGERQAGFEFRRPGRLLEGPRERRQRPSNFPMPMEMK